MTERKNLGYELSAAEYASLMRLSPEVPRTDPILPMQLGGQQFESRAYRLRQETDEVPNIVETSFVIYPASDDRPAGLITGQLTRREQTLYVQTINNLTQPHVRGLVSGAAVNLLTHNVIDLWVSGVALSKSARAMYQRLERTADKHGIRVVRENGKYEMKKSDKMVG